MAQRSTSKDRRGVLLLIVLSLLVLLVLIAITYILVANQHRQAAKAASRAKQTGTDPRDLADGAVMQLVRDLEPVARPRSPVFGHSLLEDLYGRADTFSGIIGDAVYPGSSASRPLGTTGGQFVDLVIDMNQPFTGPAGGSYHPILRHAYYNGCVLTIVSGSARGRSARIVHYDPLYVSDLANPMGVLRVMFLPDENHARTEPSDLVIAPGDRGNSRFLVNSRPFSGTGIGFNRATGMLDKRDRLGREFALMPNWTGHDFVHPPDGGATREAYWGGANESYDAADYQNLFLALEVPRADNPNELAGVIPSFHRPALMNFWINGRGLLPSDLSNATSPNERDLVRKTVFRPNPVDHPHFPRLADPVSGPWDVDNNGDGVTDSVWVDLGYPVDHSPDGRAYKPLFAILCTDLDGRFNLNAHGSLYQLEDHELTALGILTTYPVELAGGKQSRELPQGEGYGPPEIHMGANYGDLFPPGRYVRRFSKRAIRYAHNPNVWRPLPGAYGIFPAMLAPPGELGFDPLARLKLFDHPSSRLPWLTSFSSPGDPHGRFAIGLDSWGLPRFEGTAELDGGFGPRDLEHFLRPREVDESPYELNLSRSSVRGEFDTTDAADTPFTVAELERVLRAYDADALARPRRLTQLWEDVFQATTNPNFPANRRIVTTDSFDLPVYTAGTTEEIRNQFGLHHARNIVDLLWARLEHGGLDDWQINGEPFEDRNGDGVCDVSGGEWNPSIHDRNRNNRYDPGELAKLLSPDLLMGLRMDVNRPFGDGRDDLDDNVNVDEPSEARDPFTDYNRNDRFDPNEEPWNDLTNGRDVNGDGRLDAQDRMLCRQLYARHLYVLAMLLSHVPTKASDPGYLHPVHPDDPASTDTNLRRELTVRRVAQWAINVADFRDPDGILTPFEYDVNPFNGWQHIDGDPATDEGDERRIVWGCERPEYVLTETLAFHDRRVTDTQVGGTREQGDPALDSHRLPKGSAYVELCGTGNLRNMYRAPVLLHAAWDYLNLAHMPRGSMSPTWRLAVSTSRFTSHGREENNVLGRLGPNYSSNDANPTSETSTQMDPDDFYVQGDPPASGVRAEQIEIERIVWFTKKSPSATSYPHRDRVYYRRTEEPRDNDWLRGWSRGTHLVVGPRQDNWIGWDTRDGGRESQHSITTDPSIRRRIVEVENNDGSRNYPPRTQIRPSVPVVVAADHPQDWSNADRTAPYGIGFSISEPLRNNYYAEPDAPTRGGRDRHRDRPLLDSYTTPHDEPLDDQKDVIPPALLRTGTIQNFKTVFLQRLADPVLPWNPLPDRQGYDASQPVNPYITVDWMPMDLTVFNGEDNGKPEDWDTEEEFDPHAPDPPGPVHFATRERGVAAVTAGDTDLWRTLTTRPAVTPPSDPSHFVFPYRLRHSLGYLNRHFGPTPTVDSPDVGDPQKPFPWFTWNDRPFVSQFELMFVPSSSPGRLLHEFTMAESQDKLAPADAAYNADTATNKYENFKAPFGHLLNFFQTSNAPAYQAAKFYRLLDYTCVPSRFVGTESVLNPGVFAAGGPGKENFHTPFNKVSNYREPGKVNVNTITSERLWQGGILHRKIDNTARYWHPTVNPYDPNSGHGGPQWMSSIETGLVDSRRGYPGMGILAPDPRVPTFFANPVRSSHAGNLVPLPGMRRPGVECTLLRSDRVGDPGSTVHVPNEYPLFASRSNERHNHTDRNPYFRYQSIQRLGNLVTTRSNVYAVWVTVGYFEVQRSEELQHDSSHAYNDFSPQEKNDVYLDGYTLGAELGNDVGDVTRHRAFYIIDRSIPVAYEPGMNHNVEHTIRLRRFIE